LSPDVILVYITVLNDLTHYIIIKTAHFIFLISYISAFRWENVGQFFTLNVGGSTYMQCENLLWAVAMLVHVSWRYRGRSCTI